MLKYEKEYKDRYGLIPLTKEQRVDILTKNLKKKKKKERTEIFREIKRIREIKWSTYNFVIYLLPKATPRPRINREKGLFYVSGSDINKKLFHKFMKKHPHEIIKTPMIFIVEYYLPIPISSMSASEQLLAEMGYIRPIGKPDFDNVAKTYADMIQGSLIYDDALIIEGISKKFYSIKPRIEITIKYMDDFDCLFNRKKIEAKINKMKGMNENE